MDLVLAWLLFPAGLALLCAGCGTIACRISGLTAGPCVVLPLGYAVIVVVSSFAVWIPGAAPLAAPAVVAMASAGGVLWVSAPGRLRASDLWPLGAGVVVFLMYGAPIFLSGHPTFAGYISLDDASTLFAMSDRALDAGRSVHGLAPSTYEATLSTSLMTGYPLGGLLPLGIGASLIGQDVAWVFQPYLAFLGGLLSLGLYRLGRHVVGRASLRAVVAIVAAQPALLFGYALWDGVKELISAALLASLASLAVACARPRPPWIAAAIVAAALVLVLSVGGAIWLVPIAALAVALAARNRSWIGVLAAVLLTAALALPALGTVGTWLAGSHVSSWHDAGRLANLTRALSPLQAAGVWPAGDFRRHPGHLGPTYVLVALVLALAAAGVVRWVRDRAWESLALAASAVVGAVVIWAAGSPWVAAKSFATASPAVLLAAAAGCGWFVAQRRLVEAAVAATAVTGGVLWSNALAFHDVSLAPYGQLRELQAIGHRFAGSGPALMTEYQPYAVRHFLRALDPEGASELRRRLVPLRNGATLDKGAYADLDAFSTDAILVYRTVVLRRSPVESRPPAPYRLVWAGRWYQVWERPAAPLPTVVHLPLGDSSTPDARATCREIVQLGKRGTRLAAVVRDDPVFVLPVPVGRQPLTIYVPRSGTYSVWLGGSTRKRIAVLVDGHVVGTAAPQLDNEGQYVELVQAPLVAGPHTLGLRFESSWLRPGGGAPDYGTGSLVVSVTDPRLTVLTMPSPDAGRLCTLKLDWVEALS